MTNPHKTDKKVLEGTCKSDSLPLAFMGYAIEYCECNYVSLKYARVI